RRVGRQWERDLRAVPEVDRPELLVRVAVAREGLLRYDGGLERLPGHAVARVENQHGAERRPRGVARRYERGTQDGATGLRPGGCRRPELRRGCLEEPERQRHAALLELRKELRTKARRAETADDRAVSRHLVELELEQLLKGDDVGLHSLHLGDRGDPARAV